MAIAIGIDILVVLGLVAFLWGASPLFGPKRRLEGDKGLPYETGMPPLQPALDRMGVLYYRFAVLFVIFDVDLAFLIPWVLLRHELTLEAMVALSLFLLLVGLTLAYVWRKGGLECE